MAKIKFVYMKSKYEMEILNRCSLKESMSKFSSIINKTMNELYFSFKGNDKLLNDKDENNIIIKKNLVIFVCCLKNSKFKKEKFKDDFILCPECKNLAFININDEKISISNCIKNHSFNNFNIHQFIESQFINNSEIICDICKNEYYLYNNDFNLCSCNRILCPLCFENHDKNHIFIKYKNKFIFCNKHNNQIAAYCSICNINLCQKCEEEHNINHKTKIISLKEISPNENKKNEIKISIKEIQSKIIKYKYEIQKLNNLFSLNINNLISDLDNYHLFYESIYNSTYHLFNYQSIKNLSNFKNKKLIHEMNTFINDNLKNKMKNLIDIIDNKKNVMSIIYNNNNYDLSINIFGKKFVNLNKDKCFLLINGNNICELNDIYICDKKRKEKMIKIKLIEVKIIDNMSCMFYQNQYLSSIQDISRWNN